LKGRKVPAVSPPPVISKPSLIAESPLREAAAQEIAGPSPLAQKFTSAQVVLPIPFVVEETQSPTDISHLLYSTHD
jgi:hypothetical protein